jgi:hypothetical protein
VAQKIQTLFTDDIDGGPAGGTVRFSVDGTEYEIDLGAGHARVLRSARPLHRCRPAGTSFEETGPVPSQGRS